MTEIGAVAQGGWCREAKLGARPPTAVGVARAIAPPQVLADLQVRLGSVPTALPDATARGVLWEANARRFLLTVPGVARTLASDGRELMIDPAAGADELAVARVARMTPLAAIAWKRGLLAFHAAAAYPPPPARSGAALGRRAVLLCGDSGMGKSTLLAALLNRGWEMLADELAVVEIGSDGAAFVHQGARELTLWADAIDRLLPTGVLDTGSGPGRRHIAVQTGGRRAPVRLDIIWQLSGHYGELESSPVTGTGRFRAIAKYVYNTRVATALLDSADQVRGLAALASATPMGSMKRRKGQWSVEELADIVSAASPDG